MGNNSKPVARKKSRSGSSTEHLRNCWKNMIRRCENPADKRYANYGGRGISVCQQWRTFAGFLASVARRPSAEHSLDRIDNNGDYEPSNCRWATPTQQQRNKSNSVRSLFRGELMTSGQIAELTGVRWGLIYIRIKAGMTAEAAVSAPGRIKKRLTADEVRILRRERDAGATAKELIARHGLSRSVVFAALSGRSFRDVA